MSAGSSWIITILQVLCLVFILATSTSLTIILVSYINAKPIIHKTLIVLMYRDSFCLINTTAMIGFIKLILPILMKNRPPDLFYRICRICNRSQTFVVLTFWLFAASLKLIGTCSSSSRNKLDNLLGTDSVALAKVRMTTLGLITPLITTLCLTGNLSPVYDGKSRWSLLIEVSLTTLTMILIIADKITRTIQARKHASSSCHQLKVTQISISDVKISVGLEDKKKRKLLIPWKFVIFLIPGTIFVTLLVIGVDCRLEISDKFLAIELASIYEMAIGVVIPCVIIIHKPKVKKYIVKWWNNQRRRKNKVGPDKTEFSNVVFIKN